MCTRKKLIMSSICVGGEDSKCLVDEETFVSERIAALNMSLLKSDGTSQDPNAEDDFVMDDIPLVRNLSLISSS